jgi:hypothetical protein
MIESHKDSIPPSDYGVEVVPIIERERFETNVKAFNEELSKPAPDRGVLRAIFSIMSRDLFNFELALQGN